MIKWFKQLDEILRGDATQMSQLNQGRIDLPVRGLLFVTVLLGVVYGLCMGVFTVIRTGGSHDALMQLLASAIKLPLLFILTLMVTFPSLYVFNALVGSRLSLSSVLRLLAAMLGVMLAVLASLGPIVVFFSLSTTSYPFMKLLNVVMAGTCGVLGLAFLIRTLHRLALIQDPLIESAQSEDEATGGALDQVGPSTHRRARAVFKIWVIVFSLVGAQMSWVLRPFIGHPDLPFAWFRDRQSNFFVNVIESIGKVLGI